MLNASSFRRRLARSLPFYYGWVIAADTVTVSLTARTVMAVATLSVFVVPMNRRARLVPRSFFRRGQPGGPLRGGNLSAGGTLD